MKSQNYNPYVLTLNAELQGLRSKFLRRLQDNFEGIMITGALEKFDTLNFAAFVRDMDKQKIPLSLKAQDEWKSTSPIPETAAEPLPPPSPPPTKPSTASSTPSTP